MTVSLASSSGATEVDLSLRTDLAASGCIWQLIGIPTLTNADTGAQSLN